MKHRRILQEWTKFSKAMLSPSASPAQLLDMQMAFYCGVSILYRILVDLSPGKEVVESDLDMLRDIRAELKEFAAEAGRNRGTTSGKQPDSTGPTKENS